MKSVLRGKFIELSVYIKNLERSCISNLTAHLKVLEQKEVITLNRIRQQEIIKLRTEVNNIETKNNTNNQ